MTGTNNVTNNYQNLEKEYFKKLSAYVQLEKNLIEESRSYIHNINTSVKHKDFYGQNVFVNKLDLDNVATSYFSCKEVDLSHWENSNLPSSLISYDTCKGYAVNNNKPFFGVQNIDGEKSCYVKQGDVESTYVNSSSDTDHINYWKSDKGNANANVLALGYDGTLSLMSYIGNVWWEKDKIDKVYWSSGKKTPGCNQIWGDSITEVKANYGKECKKRGEWTEENGITHITDVLSKKLLHTRGSNFLIDTKLIGGEQFDPCKDELKNLELSYKCGDAETMQTVQGKENSQIDVSCPQKDCFGYFGNKDEDPFVLRLTDDGDLYIFRSSEDNTPIWQLSLQSEKVKTALGAEKIKGKYKSGWANDNGFNIHPKKNIMNDERYNKVDWLYGRDYIKAGEPLQTGMLLASQSGQCCMVLNDDGYLHLYYAAELCSAKKDGYFGKIMNVLGISKIDTERPESISNIGKIGYVIAHGSDKGKVKPYLDSHVKPTDKFSEVDKDTMFYNDHNTSQKLSNLDFDACQKKCLDNGHYCAGATWVAPNAPKLALESGEFNTPTSSEGDCYMYKHITYSSLLGSKIPAIGRHTTYKLPSVINNDSCNDKNINFIDNSKWESYDANNLIATHISPKFLCGLAAITKESKDKLNVAYKELDDVVKLLSSELKMMLMDEERLDEEKMKIVKNMKGYIKKFESIQKKHGKDENNLMRYQQLQLDTKKQFVSSDTKYIYWGILVAILLILLVKLIK